MDKKKKKNVTFVSPKGRVSYPRCFEPEEQKDENGKPDGNPKYSVTLLIPKSDEDGIKSLKKVIAQAAKEKWGGELPEGFRNPLKDGDKKKGEPEEYKGMYYAQFRKAAKYGKPQVVGPDRSPLDPGDSEGLYPGCYAKVGFSVFAYETKGNVGVGLGFEALQKVAEGERLDSKVNVDDLFEAIETEDEGADDLPF